MKNKKLVICIVVAALVSALFSSCAIDRKCPAYTQVQTENSGIRA